VQLDATTLLARSRGAPFDDAQGAVTRLSGRWKLEWTEDGRRQSRTLALAVTATAQHLGGVRYWWRCPACGRRCRVLLAVALDAPIGCRRCQRARYSGDYPARDRRRRFVALFHALGAGRLDLDDGELDVLLAARCRGVRRGRRIDLRAVRALLRLQARCDALPDLLKSGGLP
jgi:YD repeat-containing protein